MGMNNRARRAAKAKQRAKQRAAGHGSGAALGVGREHLGQEQAGRREPYGRREVATAVVGWVHRIMDDAAEADRAAVDLLRWDHELLAIVVADALSSLVEPLVASGWTPDDLGQVLRRRVGGDGPALYAGLLRAHAQAFSPSRIDDRWRRELDDLPPTFVPNLADPTDLALTLRVVATLRPLPTIAVTVAPPGQGTASRAAPAGADAARQLAKVRALLAKAESTQYDAEAEALTAKAQELIARYALDRLLTQSQTFDVASGVTTRRLWIDAPYVGAKAMLVDAVAGANRCRTVLSEALGFVSLVGDPHDLDAVELLATSLLVQADTAMLRHGRQMDRSGTSRTRAFRRAFLISFAQRIGERLRAVGESALAETPDRDRLLPVLRAASEDVEREFARVFPHIVSRPTRVSDPEGWAAGRAAADLARIDVRDQVAG